MEAEKFLPPLFDTLTNKTVRLKWQNIKSREFFYKKFDRILMVSHRLHGDLAPGFYGMIFIRQRYKTL
ncbi:hypothetical protein C5Y97_27700 [Blastopirellula marina]|uniref:Uncharacterized protein n=1 Tax=Blastopirellula marina TaxID=124 RepID=A0A2S8F4G2_9BACT|nr:hypothetical protein C5Y98_27685 [Blastopirellula marina]PTL41188.1 hypothetical protein C5Y97_27700 [Blastopirellula marina]